MNSEQEYINRAVAENCYNFLANPVIVTSGNDTTPIFLNGEKLMQDGSNYKQFEMDPFAMAEYAESRYNESEVFKNVIDYSVEKIREENFDIISGGRTRDWPFAGIIANKLGLPFLALFKDIDNEKPILYQDLTTIPEVLDNSTIQGAKVAHVVDLVTTASSVTKPQWGWIPQIRALGGNISDVYAFIDRNQGARENIAVLGANLHSFCSITPEWLQEYDPEHLEIVEAYLKDPISWTIQYLHEHGPETLKQYLDGSWDKDDRLIKFMGQNQKRLGREGLWGKIIDYSNELGTYTTHDGRFEGNLIGALRETLRTQ